ncbi:MAG: TraB/GumN family protein [Candidatus Kapabacteria bacterium]|nr:TraB/GumN family protein [Candidatus Kapabacteria bacterium]
MKSILYVAMFFAMSLGAMSQIFYEVSDPATPKAKMYLLGSIHVADSTFYPLDNRIEAAFIESNALVTEIKMDNAIETALLMRKKMMYDKNDSLRAHLADTTYNKVVKYFSKIGMGEGAIRRFSPAMVSVTLIQLSAMDRGLDAEYGIDQHFIKAAANKPQLGLETAESQVALLESMNRFENIDEIISGLIDNPGQVSTLFEQMTTAWKSHDAEKLAEIINQDVHSPAEQKFNEQMLAVRNVNFCTGIKKLLAEGKIYFGIVGAGHLVGAASTIENLEKSGCKVKRIL